MRQLLLSIALVAAACDVTGNAGADGGAGDDYHGDAVTYRSLDDHPGCSVDELSYEPAQIPGYRCAAKAYPLGDGVEEDASRPIVLLVHGNSDTPASWESMPGNDTPMLAERLIDAGFRTYAIDMRIDRVDDPQSDNDTENAARNVDHGWAVPLVQHFIESVMEAYPDRQITVIGFSLGVTVIRDALRRLHEAGAEPFARVEDLIYLAGANHGVATFPLCASNPTMRGRVTCELGNRDNYVPTAFMKPLNGPGGAYETPCVDGEHAYGTSGVCGNNAVSYVTVVMRDISDGTYQDLFVSEASAHLAGADNHLISLEDIDESGYFFDGLFKNHYGAARSEAALAIIMDEVRN